MWFHDHTLGLKHEQRAALAKAKEFVDALRPAHTRVGYAIIEPPPFKKAHHSLMGKAKSVLLRGVLDTQLKIEWASCTVYYKGEGMVEPKFMMSLGSGI